MQGAPPLASPAFNRLRHLQTFSNLNPTGGLPGWSPADLAATVPGGGLAFLSPAYPAFSLLPCPLSPSPFPNGEGEIYGYFMQGAPPLASPGLSPSGAGSRGEPLAQRGLARLVACRPCRCGARRGAEPQRHLFALPRGRGPSQTPPSLATDSSISPVPPLLGCRHCPWKGGSFGFAPNRRLPCAGHPLGRFCKCRRRFNAGVPGAKPPAK